MNNNNNNNNNNLSRKISNVDHQQTSRFRKKSIFRHHHPLNQGACATLKKRTTINDNCDTVDTTSRRRSTHFMNGGTTISYEQSNCSIMDEAPSHYDEFDHTGYKQHYRRTLLQMYAEDEQAKNDPSHSATVYTNTTTSSINSKTTAETNNMFLFIKYMATEHENLLQLLIFLPLILTSIYIAFVEKKPLVT